MTPDFECGLIVGGGAVSLASVLLAALMRWRANAASFWGQATRDDE